MARDDLGTAAVLCDEAISLFGQRDDRHGLHFCLITLARIAQRRGDIARVTGLAREILLLGRELGTRNALASVLESLAWTARMRGHSIRAARLLGAAEALREAVGVRPSAAERADYETEVPAVRASLGQVASLAWAEGRAMTPDQAIAYALEDPPSS